MAFCQTNRFIVFPEDQKWGGVEDATVSPGEDTDQKGDDKPTDGFAAKE